MKQKQFALAPPSLRTVSLTVCAASIVCITSSLTAGTVGYAPERVLLKLKAGVSDTDAQTVIASQEAFEAQAISQIGVRVLKVAPSKLAKVLDVLSHHPQVEFAEPDALIEPGFTPNDPLFSSGWQLPKIAA